LGYCEAEVIEPTPMLRKALLDDMHNSHDRSLGHPWPQDTEPHISRLVMEKAKAISPQYDPLWPFSMWLKTFQWLGTRQQQPLTELGAL